MRSSTDTQIRVQSRWPWASEVLLPYPNSLLDRLVLFIKTLRFSIPKEVEKQFLLRSIRSLKIYKHAVKYQLLAHASIYFHRETDLLSNEKFSDSLRKLESVLLERQKITPELQEDLRNWAGILVDLHSSIRLDDLLDLTKSPGQLLSSLQKIQMDIQKRTRILPVLMYASLAKQENFFERDKLVSKKNLNTDPLLKTRPLFAYFVHEKSHDEMDRLYRQIDLAAKIWNRSQGKYACRALNKFKDFFQRSVEQYGPAWDIANGLAYANLFKGI